VSPSAYGKNAFTGLFHRSGVVAVTLTSVLAALIYERPSVRCVIVAPPLEKMRNHRSPVLT